MSFQKLKHKWIHKRTDCLITVTADDKIISASKMDRQWLKLSNWGSQCIANGQQVRLSNGHKIQRKQVWAICDDERTKDQNESGSDKDVVNSSNQARKPSNRGQDKNKKKKNRLREEKDM